jgi:oligopeptidase A
MMKFTHTPQPTNAGNPRILTLPDWSTFAPGTIIAELEALIVEGRALADTVAVKTVPTFDDLVVKWDDLGDRIHKVYGPMGHLYATERARYPELKEIEEQASMLMSAYGSDISFHEGLYRAYVGYRSSGDYASRTKEEQYIINKTIKDFELAGVQLSVDKKAQLKKLSEESSQLSSDFGNNLVDAQDAWGKIVTDESLLSGIPESDKDAMCASAKEKGIDGWRITLKQPVVVAVLTYAKNRALREEMYYANVTKASEIGAHAGKWDNGPVIAGMRRIAHEKALLLGFKNAAERSLEKKMAKEAGVKGVLKFLGKLATMAHRKAHAEWKAMSEFAKTELALQEIEAWDLAYISEEMVKAKHGVDQEEVRQYFPFTKVAEGFATLVGRLYGMTFKERTDVSVPNSDVHFFEVYDESGVLRGAFYADLFAREGKRSGAWMDDAVDQIRTKDGVQIPVAYLNCNFTKPKSGEVFLNHDEMTTYFHEAGHVLHHILGKTEYLELAMMGVEWDTVELPSQLMESWCWETDMLRMMSKHKETGATIPDELIQKLIDAKYFNCGLHALRQLAMGIYDFELYATYDPKAPVDANAFHREIYQRMEVRPLPEYNRFPNSFGHIFGGGYGAGYFSYMWADGLVADVFATYKESGDVYSREVGRRFLEEVLEVGCARPMAESFRAFRGRSLDTNILAKHLGLRS